MITDGDIMISTSGEKVGQINGLTIMMNGDLSLVMLLELLQIRLLGNLELLISNVKFL